MRSDLCRVGVGQLDETAVSAVRQISRTGSVRLLADLLTEAEDEVTKLRELMVTHFCDCPKPMLGQLDAVEHVPQCRYRVMVS